MSAQLSTTDTRIANRTAEQLAVLADREQSERDAQTLARELFEARREVAQLGRELREMTEHRDALGRALASIRIVHFRTADTALAAHARLRHTQLGKR